MALFGKQKEIFEDPVDDERSDPLNIEIYGIGGEKQETPFIGRGKGDILEAIKEAKKARRMADIRKEIAELPEEEGKSPKRDSRGFLFEKAKKKRSTENSETGIKFAPKRKKVRFDFSLLNPFRSEDELKKRRDIRMGKNEATDDVPDMGRRNFLFGASRSEFDPGYKKTMIEKTGENLKAFSKKKISRRKFLDTAIKLPVTAGVTYAAFDYYSDVGSYVKKLIDKILHRENYHYEVDESALDGINKEPVVTEEQIAKKKEIETLNRDMLAYKIDGKIEFGEKQVEQKKKTLYERLANNKNLEKGLEKSHRKFMSWSDVRGEKGLKKIFEEEFIDRLAKHQNITAEQREKYLYLYEALVIQESNAGRIKDPDKLKVGQVIHLPANNEVKAIYFRDKIAPFIENLNYLLSIETIAQALEEKSKRGELGDAENDIVIKNHKHISEKDIHQKRIIVKVEKGQEVEKVVKRYSPYNLKESDLLHGLSEHGLLSRKKGEYRVGADNYLRVPAAYAPSLEDLAGGDQQILKRLCLLNPQVRSLKLPLPVDAVVRM